MAYDHLRDKGREVAALWQAVRAIAGEDDDQAVVDTMDGETDAISALRRVIRMALEAEANAEACKALTQTYKDRQKTLEDRAERLRGHAAAFMQEVGEKTLRLPEGTISWRADGPKLKGDVPSAANLPDDCVKFQRMKHEPSIKAALESGRTIGDLYLSNGGVALTIRKA